jgi:hypothetical protein
MKHTEEQIIEKAIQVMNKIDWGYDISKELRATFNSKEEAIEEDRKYIKDEKLLEFAIENAKPDYWFVGFSFEPEAEIDNNRIFLDIWDETGEPFFIRHRQAGFKILKDETGDYFIERSWTW